MSLGKLEQGHRGSMGARVIYLEQHLIGKIVDIYSILQVSAAGRGLERGWLAPSDIHRVEAWVYHAFKPLQI